MVVVGAGAVLAVVDGAEVVGGPAARARSAERASDGAHPAAARATTSPIAAPNRHRRHTPEDGRRNGTPPTRRAGRTRRLPVTVVRSSPKVGDGGLNGETRTVTDPTNGTSGSPSAAAGTLRTGTAAGRWVITAAVLGSGVAFLDGSVVNTALPTIAKDLDTDLAGLQWVLNAYLAHPRVVPRASAARSATASAAGSSSSSASSRSGPRP